MALTKLERRQRIKMRIRKKISGTATAPRMSIFRSNRQISVQIIDDINKVTLVSTSSLSKDLLENKSVNKIQQASLVGKLIAQKAIEKGISEVIFDRNGFLYHGRIKSLADAAREAGLKF